MFILNQDLESAQLLLPRFVKKLLQLMLSGSSPVYNWAIPGVVKPSLTSRALWFAFLPSLAHAKVVTVSSVANGNFHPMRSSSTVSLHSFTRNVVDQFTGVGINPEAWGTGQLVLAEDKLAELSACQMPPNNCKHEVRFLPEILFLF